MRAVVLTAGLNSAGIIGHHAATSIPGLANSLAIKNTLCMLPFLYISNFMINNFNSAVHPPLH